MPHKYHKDLRTGEGELDRYDISDIERHVDARDPWDQARETWRKKIFYAEKNRKSLEARESQLRKWASETRKQEKYAAYTKAADSVAEKIKEADTELGALNIELRRVDQAQAKGKAPVYADAPETPHVGGKAGKARRVASLRPDDLRKPSAVKAEKIDQYMKMGNFFPTPDGKKSLKWLLNKQADAQLTRARNTTTLSQLRSAEGYFNSYFEQVIQGLKAEKKDWAIDMVKDIWAKKVNPLIEARSALPGGASSTPELAKKLAGLAGLGRVMDSDVETDIKRTASPELMLGQMRDRAKEAIKLRHRFSNKRDKDFLRGIGGTLNRAGKGIFPAIRGKSFVENIAPIAEAIKNARQQATEDPIVLDDLMRYVEQNKHGGLSIKAEFAHFSPAGKKAVLTLANKYLEKNSQGKPLPTQPWERPSSYDMKQGAQRPNTLKAKSAGPAGELYPRQLELDPTGPATRTYPSKNVAGHTGALGASMAGPPAFPGPNQERGVDLHYPEQLRAEQVPLGRGSGHAEAMRERVNRVPDEAWVAHNEAYGVHNSVVPTILDKKGLGAIAARMRASTPKKPALGSLVNLVRSITPL